MTENYILLIGGAALLILGLLLISHTRKRRRKKDVPPPQPLPHRFDYSIEPAPSFPPPPISRPHPQPRPLPRAGTVTPASPPPLPRRPVLARADAHPRPAGQGRGPHGEMPCDFPCCPYDKLRNHIGERQVIFWDAPANCFRCVRGHAFKANGCIF